MARWCGCDGYTVSEECSEGILNGPMDLAEYVGSGQDNLLWVIWQMIIDRRKGL